MHYGFYTAASSMLTQMRNISTLGQNVTNSQTPGYKASRLVTSTFDYMYMTRYQNGATEQIGKNSPVSATDEVLVGWDNSSIEETSYPYNMALVGEGFFNIAGTDNQFLTRNGSFDIDEEGYLILPQVGRVQGQNGDIWIGGKDFTVDENGRVFDMNGEYADNLLITMCNDFNAMQKYSNGMYVCDDVYEVEIPTVYQSCIERSNIDLNEEYTRVMEAQSLFTACSKALQILDTMNGKAATTLASIQ